MTSLSHAPRPRRTLPFVLVMLFGLLAGLAWGGESALISAPPAVQAAAQASIAGGEPQPASHLALERTAGIVVASTPVLLRCAAVPPAWAGLTLAHGYQRSTPSLRPATTDTTVVRWRTHVPRMNDGDPPRSARFAS